LITRSTAADSIRRFLATTSLELIQFAQQGKR
jgi:hypothetical protein